MQTIVGVRFKRAGKIYYFSPGRLEIQKGDFVIVETARGIEYGQTVIGPKDVEDSEVPATLKVVQRKATEADMAKAAANKEREKEAFAICLRKIAEHGLPMKLVEVEYTFDINKIVFYFTADGRIDFRELVKDLASVFRTRIELRQIGVRDEAKLMGGLGCCGRPLCCASFLGDFEPVSIRMAKEQNLSLNPTKISGICGRLMCCLKYESDSYSERFPKREKLRPPTQGGRVMTAEGEGKVISVNMQRRSATILLDDSKTVVASWEDVVEKEAGAPSAEGGHGPEEGSEPPRRRPPRKSPPRDGREPRREPRRGPKDALARHDGAGRRGRPPGGRPEGHERPPKRRRPDRFSTGQEHDGQGRDGEPQDARGSGDPA